MSRTTAKDLMTKRFLRISTRHTLRETMGIILYGEQKKHDTGAIAVIDAEGDFAGVITPHHVILGLLGDWSPSEETDTEEVFLKSAESRFGITILEILPEESYSVPPNASLARLVALAGEGERECIPVIEEGRVEGLVYVVDIFKAAAGIALSPDDEGIAL